MRVLGLTLAASWLTLSVAAGAQALLTRTFDEDKAGALPPGFTLAVFRPLAGQTDPGKWLLRRQGSEAYLTHPAVSGGADYTMAVADASAVQDLSASVRLRLAGGARAGGLIWRYRDAQNFYAAILDLARRQITAYRIVSGNRTRIDVDEDLDLDVNAWHTLRILHEDEGLRVSLGGIRVFDENDRRDRARGAGLVGLVATPDSEVWFDDLRVEARRPR